MRVVTMAGRATEQGVAWEKGTMVRAVAVTVSVMGCIVGGDLRVFVCACMRL